MYKSRLIYNIVKWVTFILGIITTVFILSRPSINGESQVLYLAWIFATLLFFGPRLENSMDRVYCGRLVANHKIKGTDIFALILLLIELNFDIFIVPILN